MDIRDKKNIVTLKDFAPEAFSKSLLENLHEAGFVNPMLFGGALRDNYLRERVKGMKDVATNDYDIYACLDAEKVLGSASTTQEATAKLIKYVQEKLSGEVQKRPNILEKDSFNACVSIDDKGKVSCGEVSFLYMGRKIEIKFDNGKDENLLLEQRIWGDAPLNTIAMDRSGNVIAHKDFEEHAQKRIFQPFKPDSWGEKTPRYRKLSKKIPGLMYINGRMISRIRARIDSAIDTLPSIPERATKILSRIVPNA